MFSGGSQCCLPHQYRETRTGEGMAKISLPATILIPHHALWLDGSGFPNASLGAE